MGNAPTKGIQHKNRGHKKYVHWDQAVPPWPPGKPHLVPGSPNSSQPDVVTLRWDPPPDDGGAPITGYVVEHRKSGNPNWVRATTDLVLYPELRLSGLEPGWRYQFRVTAENAADLLSDPGELSQPLTVARAYRPATMAPQFSLELREAVVLENEKAEFLVHFHGIPTPKISWYKDSFEIFSSRRMRVTVDNDMSSLVIFQTAFSDEGEFKCTATNKAGHIITKARLRLEAPPCIRIPRQYEDGLLFEKDEVIRLKVSVTGRPLPRVNWYHDGDQIPFGGRFEVSNTDRSSGLRISEARRADRGEYQVRATSRLGEDLVSFLITVTDRPLPPGKARITKTSGRNVTLSWNEPDDDGGCKIGNYIVEYYRLGWNVWLKAATCRQLTTTLTDLIEGSEYKFRIKAENPYGVSDPSLESNVVFIPDPKRGMMERPVRGTGSESNIPRPDAINKKRENRRSKDSLVVRSKDSLVGRSKDSVASRSKDSVTSRSKDSLAGKDKEILDTRKRKEIDNKIRTDKETEERKKLKNELLEKLEERRSIIQQEKYDFTRRKNKENTEKRIYDLVPDDTSEVVKRQKKVELEKMDVDVPILISKAPPETDRSIKPYSQFQVTKRRGSSGERDSGVSEGSFNEGKQNFTSPLLPREDDSLLHGSSELMLVLLPQSREAQGDQDRGHTTDFSIFGDSAVPPPMSLSAPELGGGESLVTSPLRNAVSSTELLHEQAMARFYQAVAAEEAEKAKQRKESMDGKVEPPPRSKAKERKYSAENEDIQMKDVSKKLQEKTLEPAPKEDLVWQQRNQRRVPERLENFEAPVRRASPQPEINLKSILKEPTVLSTEEEEEAMFQQVRQRATDKAKEEEKKKEAISQQVQHKPSVSSKESEVRAILSNSGAGTISIMKEVKDMQENEDMKMQEEEEYYRRAELEDEEVLEEVNSEFDEEEELYKRIEEEEESFEPPQHISRFAEEEEEEDTYHPRSMVPRIPAPIAEEPSIDRISERQHTPRPTIMPKSILKNNSKFQEELNQMVERTMSPVSRELERSPPKSFRESLPMPSFITDRSSHSPSPRSEFQSPEPMEMEEESEEEELRTPTAELEEEPYYAEVENVAPVMQEEPYYAEIKPLAPATYVEEPPIRPGRRIPVSEPIQEQRTRIEELPPSVPERHIPVSEPIQEQRTRKEELPPFVPERRIPVSEPIQEQRTRVKEPLAFVPEPSIPVREPVHEKLTPIPVPEPSVPKPKPIKEELEPLDQTVPEPVMTAAEIARHRRLMMRKASIEEDSEGRGIMADYYGDIIKDHAHPKKPVRRFLNTAELKAAARRQERKPPAPETPPPPTPEPEPEPEPELEELSLDEQIKRTELSAYDRYTAPVQRPSTPSRRTSRTPDLVLIRQPSRDRSRLPSTERFHAELSKQFPVLKQRFSPERSAEEPVVVMPPLRPVTPKQEEVTEKKWRSAVSYLADLAMFLVACWLYAFKDERLAIPVLALMVFRQIYEALKRKMPKFPQLPWRQDS